MPEKCDFCDAEAKYDGKTTYGPWAYMCEKHFRTVGVGLGLGKGQKLNKEENHEQGSKKASGRH